MRRSDSAEVRQKWVWRMQRFSHSRMTVAAFCDREQVSVAAFYQWRKKLAEHPLEHVAMGPASSPVALKGFVPVKLLQQPVVIEVRLVNGVRLTLPAHDLEVLRQTLDIVSRLPAEMACGKEDE